MSPMFCAGFPFLFGGTFIEALHCHHATNRFCEFPFLFGGTFIEAVGAIAAEAGYHVISLPFRRDFH